jgi:hypothetical protein
VALSAPPVIVLAVGHIFRTLVENSFPSGPFPAENP